MHVVVLTLNRGRGSGRVARDQVRALLRAGHRVTYMHAGMTDPIPGADNRDVPLHSDVVPVHEYLPAAANAQQAVSTMEAERAGRYTTDFVAALAAIDTPDIIVAHHATITAIAAATAASLREIPYVVFVHGTGIEPRHSGGYAEPVWADIAAALEAAAGLIVTTDYVRDTLTLPLVDVPPERFFVLPCGIDPADFAGDGVNAVRAKYDLPARYVICPGALTHLKGPQNVVAASHEYADLAPTVLVGDGDIAQQLRADLGERGRLLGFVPEADKNALIAGAEILAAAPEKREHFGIVYIEAMAAGTVPVAYSGGGVDSVVTAATGVLTPRDSRALGRAIRELLTDDTQRRVLAAAGRGRARDSFDAEVLGERFVAWIEARVVGSAG